MKKTTKLETIRGTLKLSKKQIAYRLGWSPQTYAYRAKHNVIDLDILHDLESRLYVDPEYMLDKTFNMFVKPESKIRKILYTDMGVIA